MHWRPPKQVPLPYAMIMVATAILLVSGLAFGMVVLSERKWCALLTILEAPDQPPPTTERGVQIAREIHNLRTGFHC